MCIFAALGTYCSALAEFSSNCRANPSSGLEELVSRDKWVIAGWLWKANSFESWGKIWRPLSFPDQDFLEEIHGVGKCTAGNGVPGGFLPPEELLVVTVKVLSAVYLLLVAQFFGPFPTFGWILIHLLQMADPKGFVLICVTGAVTMPF